MSGSYVKSRNEAAEKFALSDKAPECCHCLQDCIDSFCAGADWSHGLIPYKDAFFRANKKIVELENRLAEADSKLRD